VARDWPRSCPERDDHEFAGCPAADFQGMIRSSPDRYCLPSTRMAFGQAVLRTEGEDKGFGAFPPDAIYVRNIATTRPPRARCQIKGARGFTTYWSPDGSKLAFTAWEMPGGISPLGRRCLKRENSPGEVKLPGIHMPTAKPKNNRCDRGPGAGDGKAIRSRGRRPAC